MKAIAYVTFVLAVFLTAGCQESEKTVSTEPGSTASSLYIVQLSLGGNWDQEKEAHLQDGFQGHTENMRRLREEGKLLIGARYGDFGMLILRADSLAEVASMMQADPMIAGGQFAAEVNEFNTFYDGSTVLE